MTSMTLNPPWKLCYRRHPVTLATAPREPLPQRSGQISVTRATVSTCMRRLAKTQPRVYNHLTIRIRICSLDASSRTSMSQTKMKRLMRWSWMKASVDRGLRMWTINCSRKIWFKMTQLSVSIRSTERWLGHKVWKKRQWQNNNVCVLLLCITNGCISCTYT